MSGRYVEENVRAVAAGIRDFGVLHTQRTLKSPEIYSLWTKYATEAATRPFASGISRAPIPPVLVTATNDVSASRNLAYTLCVVYTSG